MFSSHLVQLLDICDTPVIDIHTIPTLDNFTEVQAHLSEENVSPFRFTPQRIRLDKDDQLFEDGDVHRHLYLQNLVLAATEERQVPTVSEFKCHISGCRQLFDTLEGYEHHYNSLHRHVCSDCKRSFPSNRLLDIHILEWHDSLFQVMAEKQCMYQCLVEGCRLKFKSSQERKDHLISTHSYPSDFRFDKSKKTKRSKEHKSIQQKVEVCLQVPGNIGSQHRETDTCESMDFSLTQDIDPELLPSSEQKPCYAYKVPPSICFGHGSVRGFRSLRKKKK